MKRFLAVLLGTLVLCSVLSAKPAFGLKGGINLANASQDPDDNLDTSIKAGLIVGGSVEFSVVESNKTTIRLEGLYVQKGWKEKGTLTIPGFGSADYEGTASVNELVLAPFLVLRFPSESVTPFLQAGPELGFNLSAEAEAESGGTSAKEDIEDWADMNIGLNIGGGFAIPSGSGEVVLDARYNLGLTNMYTGDGDYTVKTNGFQVLIGYNFGVPEKD